MDSASPRANLPRIGQRYQHRTQNTPPTNRQDLESKEEEKAPLGASPDAPLLLREQRRHSVMGKDHRQFHRRAAQAAATRVLTVDVEVVVAVDSAGNLLSQQTVTQTGTSSAIAAAATTTTSGLKATSVLTAVPSPTIPAVSSIVAASPSAAVPAVSSAVAANVASAKAAGVSSLGVGVPFVMAASVSTVLPSVPSVPAFPSFSLPSVPSVPPFPSDLTVPAYPYASGVPVQAANVDTQSVTSSSSTGAVGTAATSSSSVAAPTPGSTSSTSSVAPSPSVSSSTLSNTSTSLSSSQSVSTSLQSSSTWSSSDASETAQTSSTSDSIIASLATSSQASTSYNGGGGSNPTNTIDSPAGATAASPAGATSSTPAASSGGSTPLETPKVVGSVVGSLAGAALILLVLLFLIKRHKQSKRSRGLVLTGDDTTDRGGAMTQTPVRASLVPAAFLNRFSGMSRSTVETNTTGERSFQRVSGRKLPSAFSEGMTSGQFGREGGSLSGTSFYKDDQGLYGGPGLSKEFGPGPSKEYGPRYSNEFDKDIGGTATAGAASKMNIRPGPARTPVIHHANDENPFETNTSNYRSTLSPPLSPNPDFSKRNTLGRSLASADGSRSSRFTENV